ncbi:Ycf51 family protein [Kamptonema formosum]|uniref:Ycf51 family protein n=1 Tax=Kamptonema formosum TaxID=331992 RepID=UPI0003487882|nr:Ycf51 family protein [Oscillatoria sp. PCC 10802]
MPTTAQFLTACQWAGILTLVCAVLAVLGFIFQWGVRFRLVGIASFMGVLTGGLFALSLTPLTRTQIPGAVRYSVTYDTGSTIAVIAVPPAISETELEATLRQAAGDLFSPGRFSQGDSRLTIRARTILHPEDGVSQPLYIGQVKRSLSVRNDDQMTVEIFPDFLAQLPAPPAESSAPESAAGSQEKT